MAHKASDGVRVEVISPGGQHGAKSVVLATANNKYIFNCGEGTWRYLSYERRLRLNDICGIFITHNSWDNVGGFVGLVLPLMKYNMKTDRVLVHAPPRLDMEGLVIDFKDTAGTTDSNHASHRLHGKYGKTVTVVKRDCDLGPYIDEDVRVDYVALKHDDAKEVDWLNDCPDPMWPDMPVVEKDPSVDELPQQVPSGRLSQAERSRLDIAMAFIVTPHASVRNDKTIRPVVVLECPSTEYLTSLVESKQLITLCDNAETVPDIIVHMSPADIVNEPSYQEFMKSFGDSTKHLMLNERSRAPVFHEAIKFHKNLNMLNPQLFPDLGVVETISEPVNYENKNIVQGEHKLQYRYGGLNPTVQWSGHWNNTARLHLNSDILSTVANEKVCELSDKLRIFKKRQDQSNSYPEVVFLGTSATISTKIRNVSCVLVHTSPDSCIMLDCGEGSVNQLLQYYGEQTDEILCKLKAVFISHIHLDHHGGSIGVVQAREKALRQADLPLTPLPVIAPYDMHRFFNRFSVFASSLKHSMHFISHRFYQSGKEEAAPVIQAIKDSLQLHKCKLVRVFHAAKNSYGIVLVGKAGWKMVFSGDTVPCRILIEEGMDCDLLIHEATFDNSQKARAQSVFHSTVEDAISVGKRMRARYVMLTHFSASSCRVPLCIKQNPPNFGIAFDFMKVTLSTLPSVQMHEDALLSMYNMEYIAAMKKDDRRNLQRSAVLRRRFDTPRSKQNYRRHRAYYDLHLEPNVMDHLLDRHESTSDTGDGNPETLSTSKNVNNSRMFSGQVTCVEQAGRVPRCKQQGSRVGGATTNTGRYNSVRPYGDKKRRNNEELGEMWDSAFDMISDEMDHDSTGAGVDGVEHDLPYRSLKTKLESQGRPHADEDPVGVDKRHCSKTPTVSVSECVAVEPEYDTDTDKFVKFFDYCESETGCRGKSQQEVVDDNTPADGADSMKRES